MGLGLVEQTRSCRGRLELVCGRLVNLQRALVKFLGCRARWSSASISVCAPGRLQLAVALVPRLLAAEGGGLSDSTPRHRAGPRWN